MLGVSSSVLAPFASNPTHYPLPGSSEKVCCGDRVVFSEQNPFDLKGMHEAYQMLPLCKFHRKIDKKHQAFQTQDWGVVS